MANAGAEISLSMDDLREVARFAAECAQDVLAVYEQVHAADPRPREAIDAAWAFARGGKRGKALRDAAWAALKAAGEAARPDGDALEAEATGAAARAAMSAASAAYLHPLANADQVKHILGAAAYAARAAEILAGNDPAVGADRIGRYRELASPTVVDILRRYPAAPPGGGRVGELLRALDEALRSPS